MELLLAGESSSPTPEYDLRLDDNECGGNGGVSKVILPVSLTLFYIKERTNERNKYTNLQV